jgi:hypothetical protein
LRPSCPAARSPAPTAAGPARRRPGCHRSVLPPGSTSWSRSPLASAVVQWSISLGWDARSAVMMSSRLVERGAARWWGRCSPDSAQGAHQAGTVRWLPLRPRRFLRAGTVAGRGSCAGPGCHAGRAACRDPGLVAGQQSAEVDGSSRS